MTHKVKPGCCQFRRMYLKAFKERENLNLRVKRLEEALRGTAFTSRPTACWCERKPSTGEEHWDFCNKARAAMEKV